MDTLSNVYVKSLLSAIFLATVALTNQIYTLSLHDALPISEKKSKLQDFTQFSMGKSHVPVFAIQDGNKYFFASPVKDYAGLDRFFKVDRKSTRLNSSHMSISYAVFCLKKQKIY